MHNLFEFIRRHSHWFLLLVLEFSALVMLFRWNSYQASVFWAWASETAAYVSELRSGVTAYFGLRSENKRLAERNVQLELQLERMRERLQTTGDTLSGTEKARVVCTAHVVNNSVTRPDNYITIDRGTQDGVRSEMGVVDGKGVVGIVWHVSAHYALVLPVLSQRSNLSCKIARTGYFGTLLWDGGEPLYAWLTDVPRHSEFALGDTVVTSGHSAVFPEGLMVGTVDDMSDSRDGLSYRLRVRLSSDISRLSNVCVIDCPDREERSALEDSISVKP